MSNPTSPSDPIAHRDDPYGFLPCPCGKNKDQFSRVRPQTPRESTSDPMVRRAYVRCFACHARSPLIENWTPVSWQRVGERSIQPFRDVWNDAVRSGTLIARKDDDLLKPGPG